MRFCKHKWKLLSETVTESSIEHMKRVASMVPDNGVLPSLLSRKHIQIFTCDECGKLKRFVEDV